MSRPGNSLRSPMSRREEIIGWIYLVIHMFILSYLLALMNTRLFPLLHWKQLDTARLNLVYYGFGFVFLLIFLFEYLRKSFSDMLGNLGGTLGAVLLGYAAYFVSIYAASWLLTKLLGNSVNPNSAAILAETKLNPNAMLVIGVLLAPMVEETLFRGVVFGTIRKKSRFLAYAVSALLFALYHLLSYFLGGHDWTVLLYLIQYIPAALILAWCYERGRSIWAPVFLHMLINCVSITVNLG